jgi:hypothetical protein
MARHRERIEQLVERSSLGEADARRARSRVSDATARAVLSRVVTSSSTVRSTTTGSAKSGRYVQQARDGRVRGT